ncbi:MAG: RDD family protein [Propylenella sp.]
MAGTPGLPRRLASMGYEAVLLFAVAFFAAWLFYFASGGADTTHPGAQRLELQFLIALAFAAYFLWSWLRGGQTLAMKAWKIRLVDVTPKKALLRFLLALVLVPTLLSVLWAFFDRDGQFLHDRLAGTRLTTA